jgi:hypothetical protein
MVTVRAETTDKADNLMRTGAAVFCPDCGDDRVCVVPDCGDGHGDCGDYCCTDCGAAVSVVADLVGASRAGSTRVA